MESSLVEPGVKYFFNETLKQCQKTKYSYYNSLFNFSLTIFFLLIIGLVLLVNYKNKENSYEKREKIRKQEEYLANKIHKIKQEQQRERGQMITNIPEFESIEHIRNKNFL